MNESIKFNDGNGNNDTATYLGPVLHDDILNHKIIWSDDADYLVNRERMSYITLPDIANVPISVKQYASEIHNLTPEQLNNIANPETLDNDQWDMIALHTKMNHLPFPEIMKLLEKGIINKRFVKINYSLPVCVSCIFCMSHLRPWQSKGTTWTIRKDRETEPGDCVIIDQLVSAQPVLIPLISGYLKVLRIWGATVFVDFFRLHSRCNDERYQFRWDTVSQNFIWTFSKWWRRYHQIISSG